jgi:murein tripeptide amidase MpaA
MQTLDRGARSLIMGLVLAAGIAPVALAQPDARFSTEPVVRFDGNKIVRLYPRAGKEVQDYQTAIALTDDVWTHSPMVGGPIDIRVTPEQLAAVAVSGIPFEILIDDVQARFDAEAAEVNSARAIDDAAYYTSYHNYADTKAYYQALAATYPTLCTYIVVGTSGQGNDIFGLRISAPGNNGTRPAALIHGTEHAREWVSTAVPTYIGEQMLTKYGTDATVTSLMNSIEVIVVPIMNPDGYIYTWTTNRNWRKNRAANSGSSCVGTDNNRNWGYQWGGAGASTNTCDDTYRGSAAWSAKETAVIRDFVLANPQIKAHMDYHSYSQLLMWPWSYTSAANPDQSTFNTVGTAMHTALVGTYGTQYAFGPVYTTIYPAAGASVDWMYGDNSGTAYSHPKIWSYTTELRDTGQNGFTLPANQIAPTCEENWRGIIPLLQFIQPPVTAPCYANCDGSTDSPVLTASDFTCFLAKFRAGDPTANCDGSTTTPELTANDFTCFLNAFRAGCP